MSNSAICALLLAAGALTPGVATGQGAMELAMSGPQPHFVAAWAPEKEREAERSAVLAGRVSLELRDVSLDAALKALTNAAGLRITYSQAMLPMGKRVTIRASDVAVVTAMTEMLFRSRLDVVVDRDGALALVVCKHPAARAGIQDSGTIVGTVTDRATRAPIAGATVVVEGTQLSATADSEGHYRIDRVEAGTYTARARFIGYEGLSTSVTLSAEEEVTVDFALAKAVQVLDEVVTVTPGGMQTQVRALATPVSVITADEIAQQRSQTLADLVRQTVPSAVAFYNPAFPISTNFSARGVSSIGGSSSMKVFIDGVEASNSSFSAVDPASIERIEIVRGPQGTAVYGADAAGGVVQIFTKRGDPRLSRPQVGAQAEVGVLQTPYEGFGGVVRQQYRGVVHGGSASGAVGYNFGGGYTRLADWIPNGEFSREESGSIYGGMQYGDRILTADLHARYYPGTYGTLVNPLLAETGFSFFSRPLFQPTRYNNETYGARFVVVPTSWWQNNLTVGLDRFSTQTTQTQPRFTTPGDSLFTIMATDERKASLGFNTSLTGNLTEEIGGSMTAGIDHYSSRIGGFSTFQALNTSGAIQTSPPGAFDESRTAITNTGYFVQSEISWRETAFFTAGLRADQHSSFGQGLDTPVSPRIGLSVVQEIGRTTIKARAAYGRAIRAPLPLQAAGGADAFSITLANPFLAPERQRGWDAGVDVLFGSRGSFSITGYDQASENLVARMQVASDPLTFQYQNVGQVANSGVEVEGTLSAVHWMRLKAQYGYVRSRIEDLGPGAAPGAPVRVGDRPIALPTHTAGATLTLTPGEGTTLSAGFTYVGSFRSFDLIAQYRCLGNTGPCRPTFRDYVVDYPGFERVTLALTQRIAPHLEALVSANNLTNNHAYEGINTLPVMGRITMIGLHFQY